jgi:non-specific serine/threonine protein kinase
MSDPSPLKTATALPVIDWGAWLDEDGEIRWVAAPADTLPLAVREMADALHANFALGTGSWLLALANRSVGTADAPWLQFWHRMVHLFLHRVLVMVRVGREIEETVDLPPQGNWQSFVEAMPMVPQLQRATPALLETVWRRLGDAFQKVIIAQGGDALAALSVVDPLWARTGMLTFHLAENRQSQEFPFAFVATYAQRQENGRVVLLPLAQILRQAAQSGDQALLLGILQPLQKAVQGHPFLAELVESRGVFGALAWTAGEAHEFLTASPV